MTREKGMGRRKRVETDGGGDVGGPLRMWERRSGTKMSLSVCTHVTCCRTRRVKGRKEWDPDSPFDSLTDSPFD